MYLFIAYLLTINITYLKNWFDLKCFQKWNEEGYNGVGLIYNIFEI
jgi:hypothetical protein